MHAASLTAMLYKMAQDKDLTGNDIRVALILIHTGPLRPKDIRMETGMGKSNLAHCLRRLQAGGYIQAEDTDDSRVKIYRIAL